MTKATRALQILFWSVVSIYIVTLSFTITQVDLWWQLAEGEHILKTWTLPTAPAAAYGLPAQPYFDEYAGYEVVLALIVKFGGFVVLWLIFAAIYLAILFLPAATSRAGRPAFDFSSTFALIIAAILMRERLEQRPEFVAALFLVVLVVMLRRTQLESVTRGTLLGLFALFVAWTNTHSTFIIGFFTLGLWGICEIALKFRTVPRAILFRNAAMMGGTVLLASMLNPYGPQRLIFPFKQASDPAATALSPEMWPINDIHTTAGCLAAITIAALLFGLITTRKVPLWLALFSIFAVYLSLKSYRFINLLAIATLFVYAVRADHGAKQFRNRPRFVAVALDVVLCFLWILFLFVDFWSFETAYHQARSDAQLAVHTWKYAPDICAIRMNNSGQREPALCGQWIGSYLSYGDKQFRPLLDSGMSHFTNETKRYFYFLWSEPEALALASRNLNANYILVSKETAPWVPTIHRLPGWRLVACDPTGMLWQRLGDGIQPLDPDVRAKVESSIATLRARGETMTAWAFSTLLDDPSRSLDILQNYSGQDWPETAFNHVQAWIETLPPDVVETYLAKPHRHGYPLVDALLNAQLGLHHFDLYAESIPRGPQPWYWKATEVSCALRESDLARAQEVFASIQPAPMSSVAYYKLWQQVHAHDGAPAGPYEKWQMWNAETQRFMESFSSRLNDRIAQESQAAAR